MGHDVLDKEFNQLFGPDFTDLSTEEKYDRIKDRLEFDSYAPNSEPETVSTQYFHPAVDHFMSSELEWGETGWYPSSHSQPMREYQEYLVTDELLSALIDQSPLVEVGAGNGYLSWIVNENGGDCIATDMSVTGETWCDVKEFEALEAISEFPDRAVVMCHPSGYTDWALNLLENLPEGRTFIFIGQWFPGADATPMFFAKLCDEWDLQATYPIYNWKSTHARGYVFERN